MSALRDGGIYCCEVTFHPESEALSGDTLKSISIIRDYFGETIAVGAGTVLTARNVRDAVSAGAEYMISPNTNPEVIQETKRLGKVSIPGAFTPTEAVSAYGAGADLVKLFPAGELGLGYIKALMGPLSHIPFIAVGGVSAENAADFIRAGCAGVGVGGSLVDKKKIAAGDFDGIRRMSEAFRI